MERSAIGEPVTGTATGKPLTRPVGSEPIARTTVVDTGRRLHGPDLARRCSRSPRRSLRRGRAAVLDRNRDRGGGDPAPHPPPPPPGRTGPLVAVHPQR